MNMRKPTIIKTTQYLTAVCSLCAMMGSAALVQSGDASVVMSKVKAHPETINSGDRYGMTPLHIAVLANQRDLVVYLLDQGASVTTCDNRGWMALHHAAEKGYVDIAEILIRHDANVNAANTMQWTPMHLAALRGHQLLVAFLITKGADVFALNNRQNTPYNLAVEYGHLEVRDYLVANMGKNRSLSPNNGSGQQIASQFARFK